MIFWIRRSFVICETADDHVIYVFSDWVSPLCKELRCYEWRFVHITSCLVFVGAMLLDDSYLAATLFEALCPSALFLQLFGGLVGGLLGVFRFQPEPGLFEDLGPPAPGRGWNFSWGTFTWAWGPQNIPLPDWTLAFARALCCEGILMRKDKTTCKMSTSQRKMPTNLVNINC